MAKAAYIGVSNVARKVKTPHIGVSGVARKVKSGYVGVNSVARQFLQGDILASTLSVGSSVYLMENGVAAEYLVVNQGIPSGSSLYDSTCNGTWLLRKDLYETRQWHSSNYNDYKNSTIHSYLNGDFFNLFGSIERAAIKQVKIPYVNGVYKSNVASGANGLSTKIFLLSYLAVGFTPDDTKGVQIDGAKLAYFDTGWDTAQVNKRIAYLNGTATNWWLRSPMTASLNTTYGARMVHYAGGFSATVCTGHMGIRPALILPLTALFDEETLILKGVA